MTLKWSVFCVLRLATIGRLGIVVSLLPLVLLLGCGTSRDPVGTPPTAVAVFAGEAEDATFMESQGAHGAPFMVSTDDLASRGGYLVQPTAIGDSRSGVVVAQIAFDVDEAGDYALWVRVFAPSAASDATYLGFNGETRRVYPSEKGRYVWMHVTTEPLAATRHTISLGHGEPGLKIDLFAVVRRPDVGARDLDTLVVLNDAAPGEPPTPEPDPDPDPEPEPDPDPEPEPDPDPDPEPGPDPDPEPGPDPDPGSGVRVSPSLRGDPSFDVASLSGEVALWYRRLWLEIDDGSFDPIAFAGRDCIYAYGRTLHTYVQSVLVAFRLTGDLALLDHVDEIAERMRAELRDEWRGTLDGTDGTRDGFLNWVDRYEGSAFRGKDTMRVNEIKTHALVVLMAYALEANRDLLSPGGRDYGAHADFWRDYLVNHFEAKWRERRGVPTAFPFMTRPGTHTYHSWVKWHYYMGLLTGDDAYTNEAHRMADNVWADLRPIDTAGGTAYVWAGQIVSAGGDSVHLQRTTYARYVYGDMIEFHLEGFHNWASSSQMERFARTFTAFVIDGADPLRDGFAPDIGGGRTRAGLTSGDDSRLTVDSYLQSSFPLMAAWDSSGRIEELNEAVYASIGSRGGAWLTAGAMLSASWSKDDAFAGGRP